jgi:pimeloyl-ACP methyl ester carboxylesterase
MVTDKGFRALYPFRSHILSLGSLDYHYLDEGQGEPLLMLHGNPTWSFYYRDLVRGLAGARRVVVPDHIGCGFSSKPWNYPYTLSTHIDNLEHLVVHHLDLKNITLVVHDWGGAIGMGLAVRRPERIKRLILFNTAAFLSTRIPLSIDLCRRPLFGPLAILLFNAFSRGALAYAVMKKERLTASVRSGYLAPYGSPRNRIAQLRFVQDIPVTDDVASYRVVADIERGLGQFAGRPALIIWGKRDFCFNDHFLQRWREILPGAEVREVEDAGHYVVEDAHERIVPWIEDFLARHP